MKLTLETIQVIREELTRHDVTVNTQLAAELPSIMGHKGQLQEVLLNLIQNAIDAMRTITDRIRVIRVGTELMAVKLSWCLALIMEHISGSRYRSKTAAPQCSRAVNPESELVPFDVSCRISGPECPLWVISGH